MDITIIKVMDKDHKKIKDLLMEFEKEENKNFEKSKETFMRFKWMIEKHFFVEEKAIFNFYIIELPGENDDLMRILKEHREILDLITQSEECLFDQKRLDIDNLKHYILAHAKYEDEVFYPKLDEKLTEEKKQEMIDRIKDIIMD